MIGFFALLEMKTSSSSASHQNTKGASKSEIILNNNVFKKAFIKKTMENFAQNVHVLLTLVTRQFSLQGLN